MPTCQLPFPKSEDGTHIYESLSYVWGSSDKPQSVFIGGCDLPVTTNLYNALLRLRDRFFERIIWADSIGINQEDEQEKGRQVQLMAKIYSQADRIIVYLGEEADNSDQALEDLRIAAEDEFADLSISERSQKSILKLLERPWFRRIWVLQEVAVARRILITCGPTQINGYAFCSGFDKLKLSYEAHTNLEGLIRSVTYLIRGAIFRPKYAMTASGGLTPDGLSLGELIDMYHTRESTERHDKVYALFGMSSDNPSGAGLSPDYSVPWKALFQRLIQFVVSKEAFVETWDEKQVAIIKNKGCIFGQVASAESEGTRYDRQHVRIDFYNTQSLEYKDFGDRWTLQASAKSIQEGDLVCHVEGASKPTFIRLYKDYFAVIIIAVTLRQPTTSRSVRLQELLASKKHFPHELLLVWNWDNSQKVLQDRAGHKISKEIDTLLADWSKTASNKTARLCDMGIVLNDLRFHNEALERLPEPIKDCEGNDDQISLGGLVSLALSYKGLQYWKVAEDLLFPVVQKRKLTLGMDHQDTLRSIAELASVYIGRDWSIMGLSSPHSSPLPDQIRWNRCIPEEELITAAKLLDRSLIKLLLDLRRENVLITEAVLKAAAGNDDSGRDIMALLLAGQTDALITEEVSKATARNKRSGKKIMALLLEKRSSEVKITQEVFQISARHNQDLAVLLLERRCEEVFQVLTEDDMQALAPLLEKYHGSNEFEISITEELVKVASSSYLLGLKILTLLLDRRGDEVKIMEGILEAVAGNTKSGSKMIALLLNRCGDEVKKSITEKVVKKAAENHFQDVEIMELLVNKYPNEVKSSITEEVVKKVAQNYHYGTGVMELVVSKYPDEVKSSITKEVVKKAVGNTFHCLEMIELLVSKYPDEVKSSITEEVVKKVAWNHRYGARVMGLLVNKYPDEVKSSITEELVVGAVVNLKYDVEMMELLVNKYPDEVNSSITGRVIGVAVLRSDSRSLSLLLNEGEKLITEKIFKAAASYYCLSGHDSMRVLLTQGSNEAKELITEELVKAATRNEEYGYEIIKLLSKSRWLEIERLNKASE